MFTKQEMQDLNTLFGLTHSNIDRKGRNQVQRYPLTDIGYDQEKNLIINIAVAGFSTEDISIEMIDNKLHIIGKHKPDIEEISWSQRHISVQDFERILILHGEYQNGEITASEKNGILTIKIIPEKLKESKRSIQIT